MRYLWSHYDEYLNTLTCLPKIVFRLVTPFLRKWDRNSADKVHFFIANSKTVQERIKKYYGRESSVIYPPVRYNKFQISDKKEDYYFTLSALVSYKRIDLAIQAFNQLGYKLKIAGDGPEFAKLRKIANANIEFLGRVDDKDLPDLYAKAKAFIFPGEEDFGITPLEAQASGTPVIAFRKGGVLETVIEGKTGIFFDNQTTEDLIDAIKCFEKQGVMFSPSKIRESIAQFSEERFQKEFRNFVYEKWEEFKSQK
jgi:glycosyltransferase involved in cell wall biosynthesis